MSLFIIRKLFSVSENEEESAENGNDETLLSTKVDLKENNLSNENNLNKFVVTKNSFLYPEDNFEIMKNGKI